MAALPRRTIIVADYDSTWPRIFADLAEVIGAALGPLAMAIEHVGSTSVPGLPAKPIIDMIMVIRDRSSMPEVVLALATLGYEHRGPGAVPGREQFRERDLEVPHAPGRSEAGGGRAWPAHHLDVCAQDNRELRRQIAFRDYLRAHPDMASAYGAFKRELAARHPHDIDAYMAGKGPFIEGVLELAMGAAAP